MVRKLAPKPHPDWFWSMSGGLDSTAAFALTKNLYKNYQKRPVMVYLDTGIGLPINRLYLEELADRTDHQLWTLRTNESFEEWVERDGAPGAAAHGFVRNELKGRQSRKLTTLADDPVFVMGLAADESPSRAEMPKVREKVSHTEVYPVHRLSERERAEIVLRDDGIPVHPGWCYRHPLDCFCMAHGDPSELDRAEERFPWFVKRIREIEEAAGEGLKGNLGWDGLSAVEQQSIRDGHEQMSLCSEGCSRKQRRAVVEAFRAAVDGRSVEECVEILWDGVERETREPVQQRIDAVADD